MQIRNDKIKLIYYYKKMEMCKKNKKEKEYFEYLMKAKALLEKIEG